MSFQKLANFTPKIFVKEYNTKINVKLLAERVDTILNEIGCPFSFTYQLAQFYKLYPNDDFDQDKMADLLLTSVYLFHLDDNIEETKENGLRWLELLDGKCEHGDVPVEILYGKFVKKFLDKLTKFQRSRVLTSFKDFVLCSIREHDESNQLRDMSMNQYVDFRVKNNLCGFQVCEAEYGLNLSIDEKLFKTPLMTRMWTNFSKYVSITQDLYSFKKESGEKCGEINYLNITMKQLGCGLEEAIDTSHRILHQLEYEIHQDLLRILDSNYGLDMTFFKGVGNFLHSTVDFYKICGRYN